MQCEDINQVPTPLLNDLDSALNELEMLANPVASKDEFVSNIQDDKFLKVLTINAKYVSNVAIGFQVKPNVKNRVRYKPYDLPKERPRTRSENNDNEAAVVVRNVVDELDCAIEEFRQMKKAKSLESIVTENCTESTELEVVSDCIQNLKVVE